MSNPFARLLYIQISESAKMPAPGDQIEILIEVGNPPDAAHSRTVVMIDGKPAPCAVTFAFSGSLEIGFTP